MIFWTIKKTITFSWVLLQLDVKEYLANFPRKIKLFRWPSCQDPDPVSWNEHRSCPQNTFWVVWETFYVYEYLLSRGRSFWQIFIVIFCNSLDNFVGQRNLITFIPILKGFTSKFLRALRSNFVKHSPFSL